MTVDKEGAGPAEVGRSRDMPFGFPLRRPGLDESDARTVSKESIRLQPGLVDEEQHKRRLKRGLQVACLALERLKAGLCAANRAQGCGRNCSLVKVAGIFRVIGVRVELVARRSMHLCDGPL